jgi:hypothetical protein
MTFPEEYASRVVEWEGNYGTVIFYNEEDEEISQFSYRINLRSGCPYSQVSGPTLYHRWYYRNVRRYRDKRSTREPDY